MFKIVTVFLAIILAFPKISYGFDKEEFLRFLINTSYPEVEASAKEEDTTKKDESKKEPEKEEKETMKVEDGDYIKVHIGKENAPKTSNEEESDKVVNSEYKENIRLTDEKPKILIYHTHSCETYNDSPQGNYHSTDREHSVVKVGEVLTDELEKKGFSILHNVTYHDYPEYNGSYTRSLETIKNTLKKHDSIEIAIDLHRDARDLKSEDQLKDERERMTTEINGEKAAKFFFVVGPENPNVEHIRKLANDITNIAKKKYPNLVLPVIEKPYGKFNQYVAKNHLLVEVGSNGTTTEEAQVTAKYLSEILEEYFIEYK